MTKVIIKEQLITFVCIDCGGSDITLEQPQKWDVDKQEWVSGGHPSNFWCDDCGEWTDMKCVEWHPIPQKVTP